MTNVHVTGYRNEVTATVEAFLANLPEMLGAMLVKWLPAGGAAQAAAGPAAASADAPAGWPEFTASRCGDAEIPGIIGRVHREHGYIVDPHTACAFKDLDPGRVSVVLATASPAKFPATIRDAIGIEPTDPGLEALKSRAIVKHRLPADPEAIRAFVAAHAI